MVKESKYRLLMINNMDKIKADKGSKEYIGRWGTTYKGVLRETSLKSENTSKRERLYKCLGIQV